MLVFAITSTFGYKVINCPEHQTHNHVFVYLFYISFFVYIKNGPYDQILTHVGIYFQNVCAYLNEATRNTNKILFWMFSLTSKIKNFGTFSHKVKLLLKLHPRKYRYTSVQADWFTFYVRLFTDTQLQKCKLLQLTYKL